MPLKLEAIRISISQKLPWKEIWVRMEELRTKLKEPSKNPFEFNHEFGFLGEQPTDIF